MIKRSIRGDTTIINIYAPNIGTPKYIKQILIDIKGEVDSNTIIVEALYTPLTLRQKINKDTLIQMCDTLE